MPDSL